MGTPDLHQLTTWPTNTNMIPSTVSPREPLKLTETSLFLTERKSRQPVVVILPKWDGVAKEPLTFANLQEFFLQKKRPKLSLMEEQRKLSTLLPQKMIQVDG